MKNIEITVQQLALLYQADSTLFILDVREPWELEKATLKRAVNIPLASLWKQQKALPQNKPIYVVCHHGVRSLKVALFLRQERYDAYSLRGGIDAWARDIDASIGFY
jgi:rhodanese-related sulfurtransferase